MLQALHPAINAVKIRPEHDLTGAAERADMLNMPQDIPSLRQPAIPDKPGDKSQPDPPVHCHQGPNLLIT
ncbi:hypothetical protein D3C73_1443360 [compost metagenome]